MVDTSILNDTKKMLGIDPTYTAFDTDVMMHINSVFSVLTQLGIGLETGFMIEDDSATWGNFLEDDPRFNSIRTYVYLRVRMLFDPPATSFHIAAMEKQIQEIEFRLNVQREQTEWVDPNPDLSEETDEILVLDGGSP